jgi:uncharacterized SAM-binding protein YcdF (DUF218 family)
MAAAARKKLFTWVFRLAATTGAALLLISATPLVLWWSRALATPWEDASSGTLVILSGPGVNDHSSYWRATYAVRAWRTGKFQRIIASGRPNAAEMAVLVQSAGVPRESIVIESGSRGTRENALALQRLAGDLPAPLVLVTSDFHTYRAIRAFRKAGLQPRSLPFPDGGKRGQLTNWYLRPSVFFDLVSESCAIAEYWWRGWL